MSETEGWQRNQDPEDRLGFPLLYDASRTIIRAYGVHETERDISLPAVFLVDRESGLIRWKHVGDSIADRPTEKTVLEALKRKP